MEKLLVRNAKTVCKLQTNRRRRGRRDTLGTVGVPEGLPTATHDHRCRSRVSGNRSRSTVALHVQNQTMTSPITSSTDIFFDQLKDLKSATEQTVQTLPELIGWASERKLLEALRAYSDATSRHVREITAIFEAHSHEPGSDICKAMAGLIEGGNAHITMATDVIVRDHLLIAHANRIGHYLRGASEFTLGMARSCGLGPEMDVIAEMLARHQDFTAWMAEVAAGVFNVEIGGVKGTR